MQEVTFILSHLLQGRWQLCRQVETIVDVSNRCLQKLMLSPDNTCSLCRLIWNLLLLYFIVWPCDLFSLSMTWKPLELGGPYGTIYGLLLVLHHTGWSTQRGKAPSLKSKCQTLTSYICIPICPWLCSSNSPYNLIHTHTTFVPFLHLRQIDR